MEVTAAVRRSRRRSDAGETYIEILVTLVIVGLAGVALIGALMTTITSSSTHRSLSNVDYALKSAVEQAQYQIEYAPTPLYRDCGATPPNTLLSAWNSGISWPVIPTPNYTAWISQVECFTESSSASALDGTCVSSLSTPTGVPTAPPPGNTCASDSSGIIQMTVSVQDANNNVTSLSSLVRNPSYANYSSSTF